MFIKVCPYFGRPIIWGSLIKAFDKLKQNLSETLYSFVHRALILLCAYSALIVL